MVLLKSDDITGKVERSKSERFIRSKAVFLKRGSAICA
jgi:hypothetical protein